MLNHRTRKGLSGFPDFRWQWLLNNVRKQLNQPLLNRPHRCMCPVLHAHLSKDVLDVLLDGFNADRKASGDFIIGQPVTNVA